VDDLAELTADHLLERRALPHRRELFEGCVRTLRKAVDRLRLFCREIDEEFGDVRVPLDLRRRCRSLSVSMRKSPSLAQTGRLNWVAADAAVVRESEEGIGDLEDER
jgi:hypothetical protein